MTDRAYQSPRCETCGHGVSQHGIARTPLSQPLAYGRCFVPDCDCQKFVEASHAS